MAGSVLAVAGSVQGTVCDTARGLAGSDLAIDQNLRTITAGSVRSLVICRGTARSINVLESLQGEAMT